MADQSMVTDQIGQQMDQQAQQGEQAIQQQPQPGEGGVAPQQDPVQQLQQEQDESVSSGDGSSDQKPKGTIDDQRKAILARDPKAKLPATPAMQAEYVQLITRFYLFIHDIRAVKGQKSPCQNFLMQMNNPKMSVAQAVGKATATAIYILHHGAKTQKVSYNPNVMYRAADECVAAMYLMGQARGIFQNTEPYKGKEAGKKYPYTDQEKILLMKAKMFAIQWFGHLMVKSGEISPQQAQQAKEHWDKMVQQEINSGQVTDAHMQAIMNSPQIKQQLASMQQQQGTPPQQEASLDDGSNTPTQGQEDQQSQGQQQPQQQPPPQGGGGGVAPEQNPQGAQ